MIKDMDLLSSICGNGIGFTVDGFRIVYTIIALFMWLMTAIFSIQYFKHHERNGRYFFFFGVTLVSLVGVFLSKDLFTTFIFFELMSFTSYAWVVQEETKEAIRAGGTYLAVAVIGGLAMLMGILLLNNGGYNKYLTCGLIFFGFAAKAGVYPLHIWLPKAHPVAPAPASALLSGILTKSGVFGIIIISFQMMNGDIAWGKFMLALGVVTMALGAILALFGVDLKRTLACSSMSQIGFIMVGIGTGTMLSEEGALAMRGTMLHMVNHSLLKLVLFMIAGVVFCNIHKLNLNDIRGFGRNKNFLKICFGIGVVGIGGIPLFNGYISKTLLHEGILECEHILGSGMTSMVEWIFLASGGCTLAYMIKLFWCIFVEKNADNALQEKYDAMKKTYITIPSMFAIGLSTLVLPVLGVIPTKTMDKIADLGSEFMHAPELEESISYFSAENLKGGLISIILGILIYIFVIRLFLMEGATAKERISLKGGIYADKWPTKLDLENLIFRPLLLKILPGILIFFARILDSIVDFVIVVLRKTLYSDRQVPREYVEGNAITHFFGDRFDRIHYRLTKEDRDPVKSYEHRMAMANLRASESHNIITRSLSFGLALASLGLLCTLTYLIWGAMK